MCTVNIRQGGAKKYGKTDKIPTDAAGFCTFCTTVHR